MKRFCRPVERPGQPSVESMPVSLAWVPSDGQYEGVQQACVHA